MQNHKEFGGIRRIFPHSEHQRLFSSLPKIALQNKYVEKEISFPNQNLGKTNFNGFFYIFSLIHLLMMSKMVSRFTTFLLLKIYTIYFIKYLA